MDQTKVSLMIQESDNDVNKHLIIDEKRPRKVKFLDLSKMGLAVIHEDHLQNYQNVQYLYLEGNALKEISKAFFPTLKRLKWLDIRNNKLTTVPETIVGHLFLQVLLLDGNNIERLPIELGSLSSLRGLQLSRNPIVYPPVNIINQGVQSTIDFLRKQWQQHHYPQQMQLISESHSHPSPQKCKSSLKEKKRKMVGCKSAETQQVNIHKSSKPRKVWSGVYSTGLNKCISIHPLSQQNHQKANVNVSVKNWMYDSMNYYEHKHTKNDLTIEKKSQDRTNRKKEIKSSLLRDLWLEKIRQVLATQENILQRKRNVDALKQWQNETKQIQETFSNKGSSVEICFPYDTHPQYLKMLSRQDILEDREKNPVDLSLPSSKQGESITCSISSIMTALQEVQKSQSKVKFSPRSEQQVLSYEIKKIKDLQRSLNALKLRNFGQLNIN